VMQAAGLPEVHRSATPSRPQPSAPLARMSVSRLVPANARHAAFLRLMDRKYGALGRRSQGGNARSKRRLALNLGELA
jgi:hypothetical protein